MDALRLPLGVGVIDAANQAGGDDNITVVVIEVQEAPSTDAMAASSG